MEWYQLISYSITNGIRIFVCLLTVAALLKQSEAGKQNALLSLGIGIVVALLSVTQAPPMALYVLEIIAILLILHFHFQSEIRMCIFLTFFFEVASALWDFLLSAGIAILFRKDAFISDTTPEHLLTVWIVRLLMIVFIIVLKKSVNEARRKTYHGISAIAVAGMIGVVLLGGQSVVKIPSDQLYGWVILSVILMAAIMLYRLNREYEAEKEIAKLKSEQAELLEHDYQKLNSTYAVHAKLFHDFHNHMEVIYSYISQGHTENALKYLDDLRTPVEKITQSIWTGVEAIDYLISSKIAAAERSGIKTKVNIEFPQHTNIRSTDLVAILGNLLDNAIEAAGQVDDGNRFLFLTVRRINTMLVIKVKNSYGTEPITYDGNIKTTKADKELHGWGLKSARTAAERYDGTLETSCDNGAFCVVATLSYEAE